MAEQTEWENAPQPIPDWAEPMARRFHEAYERLAPGFGYKTREASAVPWDDVPENNRLLMIRTVAEAVGCPDIEPAVKRGWHCMEIVGHGPVHCVVSDDGMRTSWHYNDRRDQAATFDELRNLLPDAAVEERNGELVIWTGLGVDPGDEEGQRLLPTPKQ